jgi:UDP-N-acetylmuramate dehydrogenase
MKNVEVKYNVNLKDYTTIKIGGIAKRLFLPKTQEEVKYLIDKYHPIIIGEGSNVLFNDERTYDDVMVLKYFKEIKRIDDTIVASAGMRLIDVCLFALKEGLTGIEFAYGIPGSVGGAIIMNAGAYGGEMKDVVHEVKTLRNSFKNEECEFSYRNSKFSNNREFVVEVTFHLYPKDKELIEMKMNELIQKRIEKQPLDKYSAGSTFKRGKDFYASLLINDCGLKGYRVNEASVSLKHAGFLINEGNASFDDFMNLIKQVQKIVFDKTNKELECEVKVIQ